MHRYLILLISVFFLGALISARAQQPDERDQPRLRGDLEVLLEVQHRADENYWAFEYPLYGNLGVLYEGEELEAALSVDLIEEVSIGETYIRGGRDYSYLKLGYYTETWRTGYSWSVVDILNDRDERYPNHVFYRNILRPNPMATMSFGGKGWAQQIIASQKQESERVEDTLLGVRSLLFRTGFESGFGVIRYAGYPPPLIFLTVKSESERTIAWGEVGWWVYMGAPDTVNGVIGVRQSFTSTFVVAEFIVQGSDLLLFLEEQSQINRYIAFDVQSYLYFNQFSTAFKAYVSTTLGERALVELGTILFFGEEGTYFSRYNIFEDNNNQIYLRLAYSY